MCLNLLGKLQITPTVYVIIFTDITNNTIRTKNRPARITNETNPLYGKRW